MKSTYRLLSIYLDRMPLPATPPAILESSKLDSIQDISVEYNLFDLDGFQRQTGGGKLLSCGRIQDILDIVDRVPWCERIYITLDYTSRALAATTLYVKRILQIENILQEHFPRITFSLAADPGQIPEYQRTCRMLYRMDRDDPDGHIL